MLKDIQKTIYNMFYNEPFYSLFLQEINLRLDRNCPSLGVSFDKKLHKFFININEDVFSKFNEKEKEAVLIHELLHILHKHITGSRDISKYPDHASANLAMDMAINQYIKDLPDGCVKVEDWVTKDNKPFPKLKPFESYYRLIEDTKDNTNKKTYERFMGPGKDGETLDQHDFEEGMSEDDKKEIMKELKNALERTIEKSSYSHSLIPEHLKDLLKDINTRIEGINYKRILRDWIKKSLALFDREATWTKPNKRYGYLAKGSKVGQIPNAFFFMDTSGSISHTEANEFLSTIDNFLKVGQKKCFLGLWHTDLYSFKKYRIGSRLKEKDFQSGGTDVKPALEMIAKRNPDLAVILTDGYFDLPKKKYSQNILWVICKQGNQNKDFLSQLPGKYLFMK